MLKEIQFRHNKTGQDGSNCCKTPKQTTKTNRLVLANSNTGFFFFFLVKPRSWAEPESWQSIQYVIGIVKQKSQTNRFVQVTTEEKPLHRLH